MVKADEELQHLNPLFSSVTPEKSSDPCLPKIGANIDFVDQNNDPVDKIRDSNNVSQVGNDCQSNGMDFIDRIFEQYNGFHTPFRNNNQNTSKRSTNKKQLSDIFYYSQTFHTADKYTSEETKSARKQAALEGRQDFCEILEHAGIDSRNFIAGVFSSKKKKRLPFECSTPKTQSPFNNSIGATPIPLTEVQCYASPLLKKSSLTPLLNEDLNPDSNNFLPPENIRTILLGITCYVDVRNEKENQSEVCKRELLVIGAKVEKNFTKKVTHVIFKGGRMSTYQKAKKLGIPIVSVIWIEACKLAKGSVDPSLYPPANMEKYEQYSPFTMLMKRRLKKLEKVDLFNRKKKTQSLRLSPSVRKNKKRKIVSESKENTAVLEHNNKVKNCTKKLNFIDIDSKSKKFNEEKNADVSSNKNDNLSESSVLAKLKLQSLPKRKSAPGALAKKRRIMHNILNNYLLKDDVAGNKNSETSRVNDTDKLAPTKQNCRDDLLEPNITPIKTNKKRKLFNPGESIMLNDVQLLKTGNSSMPDNEKNNVMSKNLGSIVISLSDAENSDDSPDKTDQSQNIQNNNLQVSRNSLSLFVQKEKPTSRGRVKQAPSIVFTSFPRSACTVLEEVIKTLGIYEIEDTVSERTTHVILQSARRTLNLFRGLARGCWILSELWITESSKAGRWLTEEQYELKSYYPAVALNRVQRQAFKNAFTVDLFSSCGPIYVSPNSVPHQEDLIELIKLCRGKIVTSARSAKIVVGNQPLIRHRKKIKVPEKWILDSICFGKQLDINAYLCYNVADTSE